MHPIISFSLSGFKIYSIYLGLMTLTLEFNSILKLFLAMNWYIQCVFVRENVSKISFRN